MKIVLNKPTLTRNDLEGVLDSLINDDLITGVTVKNFETRMSEIVNLKYSLAANSVTAAYHLIFRALEIDNNSEIIIPSFFCQAPLSALTMYSGKAVLVDNEKNSLQNSYNSFCTFNTNTRSSKYSTSIWRGNYQSTKNDAW